MDPIPLDPGTYRGTYKLVGGRPSLDLVNTVSWKGTDREHDWFDRATNVTRWGVAVGLIDDRVRRRLDRAISSEPMAWSSQLDAVRDIRETLRVAISPLAHGGVPAREAVAGLNGLLARVCGRRRLDPHTLRWSWVEPTDLVELMGPLIWDAAEVVAGTDRARLGHCPSCDWLFHDTTRNRSRRWCDMGDCGSRDKALRYYHRHKSTARAGRGSSSG